MENLKKLPLSKCFGETSKYLMNYIESNNSLHQLQFDFQPHYSTETAHAFFTKQLNSSVYKGDVGAVYLDIKKATDTLNQHILILRLSKVT